MRMWEAWSAPWLALLLVIGGIAPLSLPVLAQDPPAWFAGREKIKVGTEIQSWWENRPFNREFVYPLNRPIEVTSDFGPRGKSWHVGLDLRAPYGTPVYVIYPGVVIATSAIRIRFPKELAKLEDGLKEFEAFCGNFVIQGIFPNWNGGSGAPGTWKAEDFDWGGFVIYCHLSRIEPHIVSHRWTLVGIPSAIGFSGSSGKRVKGPHLHVGFYLSPSLDPRLLSERLRDALKNCRKSDTIEGFCLMDPETFVTARPRSLQ